MTTENTFSGIGINPKVLGSDPDPERFCEPGNCEVFSGEKFLVPMP